MTADEPLSIDEHTCSPQQTDTQSPGDATQQDTDKMTRVVLCCEPPRSLERHVRQEHHGGHDQTRQSDVGGAETCLWFTRAWKLVLKRSGAEDQSGEHEGVGVVFDLTEELLQRWNEGLHLQSSVICDLQRTRFLLAQERAAGGV